MEPRWSMETLLIHAGNEVVTAGPHHPTALPIYPSTSYQVESPERLDQVMAGEVRGFSYARHGNPTVEAFTEAMIRLEEGESGIATASGMAAIDAAFYACDLGPGDVLLLSRDLYGASLNLARTVWGSMGIRVITADFSNLQDLESILSEHRPKALLLELISNPLLKVVDLPRLVEMTEPLGTQIIVDNTFTTPLMAQPLVMGADLVVHSATKYIGGHGDAMGGVVVGTRRYQDRLHQYLKLRGGVLGPFEAWLLHRGLKTLSVRFERQAANALELAQSLYHSGHFRQVYYPLLPHHATSAMARQLFGTLGGAIVTLDLKGGRDTAYAFINRLKLVGSATTLGDVYTLCLYPAIASHRNQTPEEREEMGINEGTVRIAVGLEDPEDLIRDILNAVQ